MMVTAIRVLALKAEGEGEGWGKGEPIGGPFRSKGVLKSCFLIDGN